MATYDPGEQATAAEVAAVDAQAVVISLPRLGLVPPAAALYATAGDDEARGDADAAAELGHARALIVNEREARVMTGSDDTDRAARELAERAPCAVVTLGKRGAVAACEGRLFHAPGIEEEVVVDTTGAGDLFTAAYVWADRLGLPLAERLHWAVLYASMSVKVPTALAGAADRATLVRAGAARGLALPGPVAAVSMKEETG
jgi:sugar/nucleoside kinase (ribokinase family)